MVQQVQRSVQTVEHTLISVKPIDFPRSSATIGDTDLGLFLFFKYANHKSTYKKPPQ